MDSCASLVNTHCFILALPGRWGPADQRQNPRGPTGGGPGTKQQMFPPYLLELSLFNQLRLMALAGVWYSGSYSLLFCVCVCVGGGGHGTGGQKNKTRLRYLVPLWHSHCASSVDFWPEENPFHSNWVWMKHLCFACCLQWSAALRARWLNKPRREGRGGETGCGRWGGVVGKRKEARGDTGRKRATCEGSDKEAWAL